MAIATSPPDSNSEIKFDRVKFQYLAVLCGNFISSNIVYCILKISLSCLLYNRMCLNEA